MDWSSLQGRQSLWLAIGCVVILVVIALLAMNADARKAKWFSTPTATISNFLSQETPDDKEIHTLVQKINSAFAA